MSYEGASLREKLGQAAAYLNSEVAAARSTPEEEVLIRYTRGSGKFGWGVGDDGKRHIYIALQMYMYKMNGEPDGHHEGVWEAQFDNPMVLAQRPAPPSDPLDEPSPVPDIDPAAFTKGAWTFGDDSAVLAEGPALSHLMPLENSGLFMVTCAQIITQGTGRYAGARGLKTSLGSTWSAVNLFEEFLKKGTVAFTAATIDTFRLTRGGNIKM